jgi:hypothetical protein
MLKCANTDYVVVLCLTVFYLTVLFESWHIRMTQLKFETAISHNPSIYNFTWDRKTWQILNTPTLKHVMFLWKYKDKQYCCGHNILTEGVLVTQLSSNADLSLMNCVGYNKLLSYERYVECNSTAVCKSSPVRSCTCLRYSTCTVINLLCKPWAELVICGDTSTDYLAESYCEA